MMSGGLATQTRPTSPPLPSRKHAGGLPPTYLAHLRGLIHQWLQYQVAEPDEGLPGPSNRPLNPIPLWGTQRLQILEDTIWSVVGSHAKAGRYGLLGCDWEGWVKGSELRRKAWKEEYDARSRQPEPDEGEGRNAPPIMPASAEPSLISSTIRGLGSSLPMSTARNSATSTPIKQISRPPSAASSVGSRSRERNDGAVHETTGTAEGNLTTRLRNGSLGDDEDWMAVIQSLPGYLPLHGSQRDGWEMLSDDHATRTPIREVPGAFPQASSSTSYFSSGSKESSLLSRPIPVAPARDMLKPLICLSFSSPPVQTPGSTATQSTLRFARESSAGAESARSAGTAEGVPDSGLSGKQRSSSISGWFNNKWSEMTVSPQQELVEMEFVPGRFALPEAAGSLRRKRSSTLSRQRSNAIEPAAQPDIDSYDTDSSHSGTETGHSYPSRAKNVVLLGKGFDTPLHLAAGGQVAVVGGTILIRGISGDEERRALERVLRATIYTIQSQTLELALLDAFRIPREPDPPPRPPPKAAPQRTRTLSAPRPASPSLSRSKSQLTGPKKDGFLAKLGKEGRGMWDGLTGRRRQSNASVPMHAPHQPPGQPIEVDKHQPDVLEENDLTPAPSAILPTVAAPLPQPSQMRSLDRQLRILAQIREMLHSTTPGLVFPLPPILLRIEDEDRLRRQQVQDEIHHERDGPHANEAGSKSVSTGTAAVATADLPRAKGPAAAASRLGGDVRAGLGSLASSLDGWEGWWRLQKADLLYWTGVDPSESRAEPSGVSHEQSAQLNITARGLDPPMEEGRAGGPDRLDNAKVSGGIIACTKPIPSSCRFYTAPDDLSIRDYLEHLADEIGSHSGLDNAPVYSQVEDDSAAIANKPVVRRGSAASRTSDESASWEAVCPRSGCSVSGRDHVRVWASGEKRLLGRVTGRSSDALLADPFGAEDDKQSIAVAVRCRECGQRSVSRAIGLGEKYSWSKFLELLMYTRILVNPSLCAHTLAAAKSPPSSQPPGSADFDYILSFANLTLQLTPETQPVFDVRLPKLQIGANVVKRKTGSEAAQAASEVFVRKFGFASSTLTDGEPPASVVPIVAPSADAESRYAGEGQDEGLRAPGSSIMIRTEEPASVIAFTLSCKAYFAELSGGHVDPEATRPEATVPDEDGSLATPMSGKEKSNGWTLEIRRLNTPRDILPLRALTKKRSEASLPSARLPPPISTTPKQPSAELNLAPVTAHMGAGSKEGMDDLVKSISRATGQDVLSQTGSAMSRLSVTVPSSPHPADQVSKPSHLPPNRVDGHSGVPSMSDASMSESEMSDRSSIQAVTPRHRRRAHDAPPSSYRRAVSASVSTDASPRLPATSRFSGGTPPRSVSSRNPGHHSRTPSMSSTARETTFEPGVEGWGSVTSSFASSFNTLVRFGTDVTDSLTARVRSVPDNSRSLAALMSPFGLSVPSANGLHPSHTSSSGVGPASMTMHGDRPHIQLSLSGATHKISCTVYFAAAFDTLRRRCAFDRSMVRSLEKTIGWIAEGGKSKASFWKTADGKLVVKSLVNKWNVSDLQALLEIAPAYFEHMANTHNKATSLAKIVGFYSVKIHDLKSNEKRTLDLLVMDNLFHQHDIERQFDIKGIEGRRVPRGKEDSTTLFDGEWLDAQAADPILIHPHSRRILLDSVATDTRFLSLQSIMDYSLLLGLDDKNKQLVVGLVDAVGSYSLFKNIESMGKMALNRGREGEVTIIPPDQYRERFETALRTYFIACPDKWSRSIAAKRTGYPVDLVPEIF